MWVATLPQVQLHAEVDDARLGAALLFIGLGALLSIRIAGGVADRFPRATLPGALAALPWQGSCRRLPSGPGRCRPRREPIPPAGQAARCRSVRRRSGQPARCGDGPACVGLLSGATTLPTALSAVAVLAAALGLISPATRRLDPQTIVGNLPPRDG